MLRRAALIGLMGAALLLPASAYAADQLVKVGDFDSPVYITAPPGDPHRLFVVEQSGTIQVLVDGQKQATPFLDITGKVTRSEEQGLLSMAFAPDYATSGKFYVYYTSKDCPSSPGCTERVSQFTRSASNPNVASTTELPLLSLAHPGDSNHNGGQLQFGPDGYLYISTGDGGDEDDTHHNAQFANNSHLLGKILRINPASPNASVPGNIAGTLIYVYGLRNPWRWSFDRLTGDMIIGDVGQGSREEIDYAHRGQNAGANYGWPCFEGLEKNTDNPPKGGPVEDYPECTSLAVQQTVQPVHDYPHSGGSFSGAGIIGGYVVRDPSLTDLYGRYLYGDLSTPGLRSIALAQPTATDDRAAGLSVSNLSSFGEDAGGCVYAASVGNGGVWRIAPDTNPTPGPCPLTGPPVGPGKDTTPPKLSIHRRKRQRVLRTHSIVVGAVSNEIATITGTATVRVSKHASAVLRFKRATRHATAGKQVRLKLKLSKRTLRKLRRAMRHHKSKIAHVTITAKDGAGNKRTRRVQVRLVH
ncbi:MAG TPA: PQQ-dependent sugar dehydrogenase [Thermoleophilaceae bacterium]